MSDIEQDFGQDQRGFRKRHLDQDKGSRKGPAQQRFRNEGHHVEDNEEQEESADEQDDFDRRDGRSGQRPVKQPRKQAPKGASSAFAKASTLLRAGPSASASIGGSSRGRRIIEEDEEDEEDEDDVNSRDVEDDDDDDENNLADRSRPSRPQGLGQDSRHVLDANEHLPQFRAETMHAIFKQVWADPGTKAHKDALRLSAEYLRLFTIEALHRTAAYQKEQEDEELREDVVPIELDSLEAITPQLMMDF
ncbi:hypothetical protein BGW38_005213 [Lunasporangiospora selenospora]|uniref:Uncharacterized protein n=1 Tax=Lunasporangiospora selenospora TaxID=979761 RepID=A0A9P6G0V4_9FUNG|nr:hypothetical protein BGW38_005213 [Lunasporangiospora selenospora]